MINININNFGGAPMGGMGGGFGSTGGGFGAMGGSFSAMSGSFGSMGGMSSPMAGMMGAGSPMGGMMSPMGGSPMMGGGSPMGAMGGVDPQQQTMMSMMSMMMMMMMAKMMSGMMNGQVPMGMGPGQFGGMNAAGSPLGGFLGGGNQPLGKAPKGAKKGAGAGTEVRMSGGKVGNINVAKLIKAIPSSYHANAKKHWPSIVAEAQKQGIKNKAQLAYILATTVHESGAGKYMEEIASGSAYEGRSDLGNNRSGDGTRFKGRGYVQITGRNNYTKWGKKLGMNLVGNPEQAERPAVAAKILVGGMKEGSFTGKKLDDFIGGGKTDFNGARGIVNGSDKAGTFAATAQAILKAMD